MKLTSVVLVEGDYKILEELAKITNGLWNKAVHLEREKLKEGKFAFYAELCNTLKNDPLYQLLPSQTAQAVLQKLDGALRSYIKLKHNGRKARMPRTTGKHLNMIDGGDKGSRLPVAEFEKKLQAVISNVSKVLQLLDQPEKLGLLELLDNKQKIEIPAT